MQGAFLCGRDRRTGRDHSHRRQWLVERIRLLARCFAVEVHAYCIMGNHFHLVVRYDPLACRRWSDGEVARRWVDAFPPKEKGRVAEERRPEARELLLGDPERLFRARRTLGSLSGFMKHLKQPIARRANEESGARGHFHEQRFHSGALLSEAALLAAMAYVDLNPVRAGLAERIEACRETSIAERLEENSAEALAAYLAPLASGLDAGDAGRADVLRRRTRIRRSCGSRSADRAEPAAAVPVGQPERVRRHGARHGRGGRRTGGAAPGPRGGVAGTHSRARQAPAGVRARGTAGRLDRPARSATPRDAAARLTHPFSVPRPRGRTPHDHVPPVAANRRGSSAAVTSRRAPRNGRRLPAPLLRAAPTISWPSAVALRRASPRMPGVMAAGRRCQ